MVPKLKKSSTTGLTAAGKPRRPEAVLSAKPLPAPPGLQGLEYVLQCTYGHYPWDDWEKAALTAGVPQDLAGLGRLTMREAFQHDWPERLKSLCGWRDDGQALLALALRSPAPARRRWKILMRTDGLRGDYPPSPRLRRAGRPPSTEWTWGYLKADARRLLSVLSDQPSAR
jgi:hypothetical protein